MSHETEEVARMSLARPNGEKFLAGRDIFGILLATNYHP